MSQGTIRHSPTGDKQDLQANSQGGLKNVLGAVGQGLVPTASAFLGGQLVGSGAYTQQILGGLAPALAFGTVDAARQATGALGGFLFPTGNPVATPTTATYNSDGTVDATNLNGWADGGG